MDKQEIKLDIRQIIYGLGMAVDLDRWDEEGKGYMRVVHVSELRENVHSCTLFKERSIFDHLNTLSIHLLEVGQRTRAQQIKQLLES